MMDSIRAILAMPEWQYAVGPLIVVLGLLLVWRLLEMLERNAKSEEEIEAEIEAMARQFQKEGVNPAVCRRTAHILIMTAFVLGSILCMLLFLRRFYESAWFWIGLFLWGAVCFAVDSAVKNSMLIIEIRRRDKRD